MAFSAELTQTMHTEQATILRVEGGHVYLQARQTSSCDGCSLRSGCGHRLLDQIFPGKTQTPVIASLPVDADPGDYKAGQSVSISMEEGALLKGAFLLYGLPLFGLLAGSMLTAAMGVHELLVLVGGMAGLTTGLLTVKSRRCNIERAALLILDNNGPEKPGQLIASDRPG